ncbi:FKBP-type peptidyl-prolyl cis-trans isomerase [Tenuifilum thalassicum]|uniref:Peptidyl-prolyl cis-trans isomerase n=1 Tax=Tenuifilum thalassicum TaxID=2590900 RepID=A0A7D4C893_9BACT|nr:FKBP-type peptidyl-prolyl cis-trans isomerase [Tenuifilum thalassicum]QKG79442.1 FKBP-type peptidyl-prolyl cis-trans isomerase [Tenuifilum thalassicum]
MKFKSLLVAALAFPVMVSCQSSNKKVGKVILKSDTDSLSYALGVNISSSFKNANFKEINFKAVARAIQDVYSDDSAQVKMTNEEAMNVIRTYFDRQQKKLAEENRIASEKFLEENKTKEGVIVDSSGLQYKIIEEGTGPMPTAEDVVKVHYKGTLIDGTQFDSSYDRGEPAQFKLNQVIKGWTIGLQKMKVGSKFILYIPSDLAYGETVRPGGPIGPNQALIFEVELLDIVKDTSNNK